MTQELNKTHDLKLLSPEFAPRPGWGGQLGQWYRMTGRTLLERLLIIVAIPVVLAPILQRGADLLGPEPTATPTHELKISATVPAGEGIIHAARSALYEYLALQPVPLSLAPEQYVFAEDWLARRMEPYTPEPGEVLDFSYDVLAAAVLKAQSMTPQERASWLRFVR